MRIDELVNLPNLELYHYTDTNSLKKILRSESITAFDYNDDTVSLTRNRFFDISTTYAISGPKPWRIGLNYQKLKSDYKVFPYRDNYLRNTSKTQGRWSSQHQNDVLPDESEERVQGDIYPLFHYMTSLGIDTRLVHPYLHPMHFGYEYEMSGHNTVDYEEHYPDFANFKEIDHIINTNPGLDYEKNTQNLFFDLLNRILGTEEYKKIFGKTRKTGFSLLLPIYAINIAEKKQEPIQEYLKRLYKDIELPNKKEFIDIDDPESSTKRYEKSSMFNNKTKKYSG